MIEMEGNSSVILSGSSVISLYSETEMRVQCGTLTICVSGEGLELYALDETELAIAGWIMQVDFLTGEKPIW